MLAARDGRAEVAGLLIGHHADLAARDSKTRRTALDIAVDNDEQAVMKLLRAAGAR